MLSSQRTVIKNAISLYGLTFSNYFIGLLMFPYLSRVLSVGAFGVIGYATSLCTVFQMVIEYGFQLSTTADIALCRSNKVKVSRIVSTMTCSKLLLAVVSFAAFLACCFLVDSLRGYAALLVLFFADYAIKALLPDSYFRGIERMGEITVRSVAVRSGILVGTLLLVKGDETLYAYPIIMIVCDMAALAWAFVLIRRDGIALVRPSAGDVVSAIREGFWFFVSRISASINGSLGSLFLGTAFSPDSFVMGIYSGATRLSTAAQQMTSPIGDALYPSMMSGKDYRLFFRALAVGGGVWVVGCVGAAALATPLCEIVLGSQYTEAGDALRVLMVGVAFGFFSNLFGYSALSPLGLSKQANLGIAVSTAVSLATFVVLWATGNINLTSVCIVVSGMNVISFAYRFTMFCLAWRKRRSPNTSEGARDGDVDGDV